MSQVYSTKSKHLSAWLLSLGIVAFDCYLVTRLNSSLFFFSILQLPAGLGLLLRGIGTRQKGLILTGLIFLAAPFITTHLEGPAIQWIAQYAGPEQVVQEGRALIRYAQANPSKNSHAYQYLKGDPRIPPSIAKLSPLYIWTSGDSLEMKKYGMGTWTGYVVTLDDTAPSGHQVVHLANGLWWVDRD